VTIEDINDHAPRFEQDQYSLVLPEGPYGSGSAIGHPITAVDEDRGDNGRVTYALDGHVGAPFTIDPTTGQVRAVGDVDREQQDLYEMMVVVCANGTPCCDLLPTCRPPIMEHHRYQVTSL
jgi:hypothetical protein